MNKSLIPFQNAQWSDVEKDLKQQIIKTISNQSEEYILNINEEEYIDYLIKEYTIHPLTIGKAPCHIGNFRSESLYNPNIYRYQGAYELYKIEVAYPFEGDYWLLGVCPSRSHFIISGRQNAEVHFNSDCSTVSILVEFDKMDKIEFNNQLKAAYEKNFNEQNINNINAHVSEFNENLKQFISSVFNEYKEKYLRKAVFLAAIKVSSNPSMPQTFSVPAVRIYNEKPQINKHHSYNIEPTLHFDTYIHILQVLRGIGRSFETKPNNYIGKNEEEIRDAFLPILETHFEGCTATGETFNYNGKTDILIRHSDGTNIFVGECKFWKGAKYLSDAINQLFNRYLTWRDTKTALLIFIKQDNISEIIRKINEVCCTHDYFVKYEKATDENSFSYIFHLPMDKKRLIYLEVLVFHFNKNKKRKGL